MTVLERVTTALAKIERTGAFATQLRCSSEDLQLEVRGVGRIRFPISATQARKLRSVAKPAPYGLRDQTLRDDSVRDTWAIPKSRVKIDLRRWKRTLEPQLEVMRRQLGLPEGGALRAVLDKMLVYETGQFFAPHQDSERSDDMVGSLVVALPSEYSGGALIVQQGDEKKTFRRSRAAPNDLRLMALLDKGEIEEARTKTESLLPTWGAWGAGAKVEQGASFFTKVLGVAHALDNPETAAALLRPFDAHRITPGSTSDFVVLVERYGAAWSQDLFSTWWKRGYTGAPSTLSNLAPFCGALYESANEDAATLAVWILESETKGFRKCFEADMQTPPRWQEARALAELENAFVSLLECAAVIDGTSTRNELIAFLIDPESDFPQRTLGALLRKCAEKRTPGATRALGAHALYSHVVATQEAAVDRPGRDPEDWSIDAPRGCDCDRCTELAAFLRDPKRREHSWPLAKQGRKHIHGMIDDHALPVSHGTIRQGSPFTLKLKKEKELFRLAAEELKQQKALLSWLEKHRRSFAEEAR